VHECSGEGFGSTLGRVTVLRRSDHKLLSNLAMMGFACAALILSMSDDMPKLLRAGLWRAIAIGTATEHRLSIDLFDRTDLGLAPDEFGHLILWGAGMLGIGLATRNRFQASFVAVTLFGASLSLEVGQSLLTTNRATSIGDALANATGIMAGLTALVVLEVAIRAFSPKTEH
jgi:hypothetical protein